MIYANLPVTCRFIPVDINDEVFQLVFMSNFGAYLKRASLVYMNWVNNPETLSEAKILYAADWAKKLYNNMEEINDDMSEYIGNCLENKRTNYIMNNVDFTHIGFDFGDVTPDNINNGITLYNAILDKL
jgi:hypothetical protein